MQLKVFAATLLRRWYLVLLALICTAAATFLAVDKVGPTYEAKGAVLVLPPVATVQRGSQSDTLGNPYLVLDGLSQIRDIVIRAITAQATHDELCQQRADPAYEVMRVELCKVRPEVIYEATPDYTNRAPIILVTVEADSAANAATALTAVMDRVPEILADLQSGLRLGANAEITSALLTADTKPEIVYKNQIRAGIVAGAGTLSFFLLMIGLLDGVLAARRGRRAVSAEDQAASTAPDRLSAPQAVPTAPARAVVAPQAASADQRVVAGCPAPRRHRRCPLRRTRSMS